MNRPTLQLTSVTIGTSMPHALARFYARLLGWAVTATEPPCPGEPAKAGWVQVRSPQGVVGPTLNFEYERCFRRPVWPAVPGEQTATEHLDLHVDELAAAIDWAVACGAVVAEVQPQAHVRVMRDPDGHPFCLYL